MLDHVQVDSYGSQTNLAAVAQASLKGPQLMVLTVYDPEVTKKSDSKASLAPFFFSYFFQKKFIKSREGFFPLD